MWQYILLSRNDRLAGIGKQESSSWNAQINNKHGEEQAHIYIAQTSLNCADTTPQPRLADGNRPEDLSVYYSLTEKNNVILDYYGV